MESLSKVASKLILGGILIIIVVVFAYLLGFLSIGYDKSIELITFSKLDSNPLRKNVVLRFNRGWQIRSQYVDIQDNNLFTYVKVKFKNTDDKSMVVSLSLDSNSAITFNCTECNGFIDVLKPKEEKTIFEGDIDDFVGKIIRISNKGYLKTSFELAFESDKARKLQQPIKIFAYIPKGTI